MFIHSFIHSFCKCLLNTYFMPALFCARVLSILAAYYNNLVHLENKQTKNSPKRIKRNPKLKLIPGPFNLFCLMDMGGSWRYHNGWESYCPCLHRAYGLVQGLAYLPHNLRPKSCLFLHSPWAEIGILFLKVCSKKINRHRCEKDLYVVCKA